MNRRLFLKNSFFSLISSSFLNSSFALRNNTFNLNYAPHFGLFEYSSGKDLIDQIQFMYDQGFRSIEDNSFKSRPKNDQERISNKLENLGMEMGVFVAHKIYWNKPNLASGNLDYRNEFIQHIKASIEVSKRINAKWMTVVPGFLDLRLNISYQTSNVIETLKIASSILEPHGLVMVLEPLNFRDHPGMFLSESPQALEICKSVNSPSCKILFDIYHQQIQEGNLIPNIDLCWDEISYFQIGDNPGRKEPLTGEINYKNIFKHIYNKGYKGILGMEHGNSIKEREGEISTIKSYRKVDNFLS